MASNILRKNKKLFLKIDKELFLRARLVLTWAEIGKQGKLNKIKELAAFMGLGHCEVFPKQEKLSLCTCHTLLYPAFPTPLRTIYSPCSKVKMKGRK